ncbi:MAG TPA: DUF4097 family beta strand repeat-containing protein [Candidatus Baltobacteraceae bacterium]|nr:DUF4097 family beta strand repeat-containing protein [Candidatus Baltobacteraceae bacterium]
MRYSRTGIVVVLLAAELFIGAAIIWCLDGRFSVQAAGLHAVDAHGKTLAPIDAGDAPHVVIDDPDSRVVITASTDGKVHVTDDSRTWGWVWGTPTVPPLTAARTADGVSIRRANGNLHVGILGIDFQHTEVAVPPAAFLDITRCGGAQVTGITGEVGIHSVDGSISLNGVHSTKITLASDDGSLRLNDVRTPNIDAVTNDGSIRAAGLSVDGGRLQSSDGSIHVGLLAANLAVHAHTDDGSIRFNGERAAQDEDSGTADYQVGTGGGSLRVSTQDGSIHINTNGAI